MTKQLRIVTATLRYPAFTETGQEAIDFIYQAIEDWQFADDKASAEVVASLDSRSMLLPKDDIVYHESMGNGIDLTIEEAFRKSPKPKSLPPTLEDQPRPSL